MLLFMTRTNWRRVSVLVSALMLACESSQNGPPSSPSGSDVSATTLLGPIEAKMVVPARVPKGVPVSVSVNLTNRGDTTAALSISNDLIPFDLVVSRVSGDSVWRRPVPELRPLVQVMTPPLAPGATQPLGIGRWDQVDSRGRRVSAGTYEIRVVLWTDSPVANVPIGPVTVQIDP